MGELIAILIIAVGIGLIILVGSAVIGIIVLVVKGLLRLFFGTSGPDRGQPPSPAHGRVSTRPSIPGVPSVPGSLCRGSPTVQEPAATFQKTCHWCGEVFAGNPASTFCRACEALSVDQMGEALSSSGRDAHPPQGRSSRIGQGQADKRCPGCGEPIRSQGRELSCPRCGVTVRHRFDAPGWVMVSGITRPDVPKERPSESLPEVFYSKIRGVTFEDRQEYVRQLRAGQQLALRREPENRYDKNAIALLDSSSRQLGYVGKELAERMAPLMDAGAVFVVRVADVTGGGCGGYYGANIEILSKGSLSVPGRIGRSPREPQDFHRTPRPPSATPRAGREPAFDEDVELITLKDTAAILSEAVGSEVTAQEIRSLAAAGHLRYDSERSASDLLVFKSDVLKLRKYVWDTGSLTGEEQTVHSSQSTTVPKTKHPGLPTVPPHDGVEKGSPQSQSEARPGANPKEERPFFAVGVEYRDRRGSYVVTGIDGGEITYRYADGAEKRASAELKERIHLNILMEEKAGQTRQTPPVHIYGSAGGGSPQNYRTSEDVDDWETDKDAADFYDELAYWQEWGYTVSDSDYPGVNDDL